jgi:uncharacterized protein YerC
MPKLSKRPLSPKTEKELIGELWRALRELDERERVYLVDNLLTPTEKLMLAKRLAVLRELGKGASYETIREKFKVISNTVSRVSNTLRHAPQLLPILGKLDQSKGENKNSTVKKQNSPKKESSQKKNSSRRPMGSRTLAGSKRVMSWWV